VTDPFAQPAVVEPAATEDDGVARDGYGRYLLPDPAKPKARKPKAFTRATTFAKSISDTYALSMWGQRMAIHGVATNPDILEAVRRTSLEDRNGLNNLAELAKERAGAKTAAELGTLLHGLSEQLDRGEITLEEIPGVFRRDLAAYLAALEDMGLEVVDSMAGPHSMIERIVLNLTYEIAGTFDRIVRATRDILVRVVGGGFRTIKAGTLLIFDLKTGRTLEYGWQEIAIQLALYRNADHIYVKATNSYVPMPDLDALTGLVLHLPVGQAKATIYAVDIASGWAACDLCAKVRGWRKVKTLAEPLTVVEAPTEAYQATSERADQPLKVTAERVVADVGIVVREASWTERVDALTTLTGLSRLKIDAERAGAWTPSLEAAALRRKDQILAETAAG